ncbi:hypothetical protein [Actinoplanes sp. NPDC049118]|uniref:TY-Chap2 family putative peptide chaperone n=1 Tax=Actinoplanes sp. NPDC049118 TaxID=3155769 RepID=UPI0033FD9B67
MEISISPLLKHALSWWFAASLARRHPELWIFETHPGGGLYDCLDSVTLGNGSTDPYISINRAGSVHFPRSGADAWQFTRLLHPSGELIRKAEETTGLSTPASTPAATPRNLAYRVAATLTGMTANAAKWFAVRSALVDSSGMDGGTERGFRTFPLAVERRERRERDAAQGDLPYQLWMVERAGETVAAIDADGYAYVGSGCVNLLETYQDCGRRINRTAVTIFGGLLP